MIFVIDGDEVMRGCIAKACDDEVREFGDAIAAMVAIGEGLVPEMILMDVMLPGPDGFTFLNELVSYDDTAKIPVVLISAVDFGKRDLSAYGVVATLLKDKFRPEEVRRLVRDYAK